MSRECIVSVGMSNYCLYGGGTNLATKEYQTEYNKKNVSYIFISPLLLHGKRYGFTKKYWSVVIDGAHISDLSTKSVVKYLKRICDDGIKIRELHIHHFQFIDFEQFETIITKLDCRIVMFIHDYSTVCSNFTLLDDSLVYCGDCGIKKEKCKKCRYYTESKRKNEMYIQLWNKFKDRIEFVFPSIVARNVWLSAYPEYSNKARVVPHQIFDGEYHGNRAPVDGNRKLRIAYLGAREYYKGWDSFIKVFSRFGIDNRFSWYYFGTDKVLEEGITSVYVDNRKNKDSMIQSLRENEIDAVVLWSLCKETYSYTFFESLASNVFVITNENSGNIAAQVLIYSNGVVLRDENQLLDFFNKDIISVLSIYKNSKIVCPKNLIANTELIEEANFNHSSFVKIKPKMNLREFLYFAIEKIHFWIKRKCKE